jgi:hypothetical protein
MDVDFDPVEHEFWQKRGPLMRALLLVIPAIAILFAAIAQAYGEGIPAFILGIGVGFVVWGAVVAHAK